MFQRISEPQDASRSKFAAKFALSCSERLFLVRFECAAMTRLDAEEFFGAEFLFPHALPIQDTAP